MPLSFLRQTQFAGRSWVGVDALVFGRGTKQRNTCLSHTFDGHPASSFLEPFYVLMAHTPLLSRPLDAF